MVGALLAPAPVWKLQSRSPLGRCRPAARRRCGPRTRGCRRSWRSPRSTAPGSASASDLPVVASIAVRVAVVREPKAGDRDRAADRTGRPCPGWPGMADRPSTPARRSARRRRSCSSSGCSSTAASSSRPGARRDDGQVSSSSGVNICAAAIDLQRLVALRRLLRDLHLTCANCASRRSCGTNGG